MEKRKHTINRRLLYSSSVKIGGKALENLNIILNLSYRFILNILSVLYLFWTLKNLLYSKSK